MNIDFFVPSLAKQTGGLERAITGLIDALQRCGTEVTVNPSPADATGACAHFHGLWDAKMIGTYRHYRKEQRPYLISPHGMLEPWAWQHRRWKKRPYFQLFEQANLSGAAAILATSPLEARNISKRVPQAKRVVDIPLGIDSPPETTSSHSAKEDTFRILFLSRIDVKKGIDMLLEALRGKPQAVSGREIELHIVGEGDQAYEASLRSYAERHAADLPRIVWHGGVWGDEKWAHLRDADLFCLPTHSENFGIAVLEAMAVGTQVLTTDQTPWGELAPVEGMTICHDDLPSLEAALATFLTKVEWAPPERKALAKWTHRHFAWDGLAPRYQELYQEISR